MQFVYTANIDIGDIFHIYTSKDIYIARSNDVTERYSGEKCTCLQLYGTTQVKKNIQTAKISAVTSVDIFKTFIELRQL